MAGSELTDLTPAVVGDLDDDTLFYIVADPAGSPADKSLALSVLQDRLSATFARLRTWASAGMWALTNVTRNSDGVVTSADITWPDGSAGEFTGTPNLTFGALDAWTATHTDSGQQVRQPTVTRNADGDVTDAPALIVEVIP